MPSQNFRVKNGLEVGTGVTISSTSSTFSQLNVTGVSTFQGSIYLGDNDNIIIGDGSDLKLYHTGSNSFIDDAGTGNLYIRGSNSVQIESIGGESSAKFNENGAVELYYDNSKKFETTGTGVTVTGTTFTNQLNVSGVSTFNSTVTIPSSRVAIGTDTFAESQDLDGTLLVKRDAGIARIRVRNNSGANGTYSSLNLKTPNSDWSLYVEGDANVFRIFDVNQGAARVHINSSGNFGINNTSPTRTLDVTGNAAISSNLNVSGIITSSAGTLGSNGNGTRTVSTSDPSGGSNGDVWYKV